MPKACYLLGVDIETGGPILGTHQLIAIGMCVYKWNGKDMDGLELMDTCEVHIEGQDDLLKDYDADTLSWWRGHQASWDIVTSDTVSKEEAAEQLILFLRKWQSVALNSKLAFKTIVDNCWFDDTWTSWFLCTYGKHLGGLPLRYNYYTGYTKVDHMIDINQRTKALSDAGLSLDSKFESSVPHDHTPVSDSRCIVERYVHYMINLKPLRKHPKPSTPSAPSEIIGFMF